MVTGEYLLTLHEERVSLPSVLALDPPKERSKGYVVDSVLDMMLASTFSALEDVGLSLDALAASWTDGRAGGVPRARLRATVATLSAMRRWVTAEQAGFERVGVEIGALPGFGTDEEPISTVWASTSLACWPRSTPPPTGLGCCSTSS